jgi:hypothetical protein
MGLTVGKNLVHGHHLVEEESLVHQNVEITVLQDHHQDATNIIEIDQSHHTL